MESIGNCRSINPGTSFITGNKITYAFMESIIKDHHGFSQIRWIKWSVALLWLDVRLVVRISELKTLILMDIKSPRFEIIGVWHYVHFPFFASQISAIFSPKIHDTATNIAAHRKTSLLMTGFCVLFRSRLKGQCRK